MCRVGKDKRCGREESDYSSRTQWRRESLLVTGWRSVGGPWKRRTGGEWHRERGGRMLWLVILPNALPSPRFISDARGLETCAR